MRSKSNEATFTVPVADGSVVGHCWSPDVEPAGVVVVHPATATPERFYSTFAQFVAGQGLAAVTYDYRGTGASGDPKEHQRLRMRDWMSQDVPAVAEWTRTQFPGLPLYAVGHSIGGHAMVLGYGLDDVERFATIAAHVASTRQITPVGERIRVGAILNLIGPALSRGLGYMPGKWLGLGEDIPSAAMIEWGRWARRTGYFFDDPTLDAIDRASHVEVPVLAIGASDDPWASPRQVDALTARLSAAPVQRRTYTPAELGVTRIGHHGLLRRNTGEKAWPELLTWLTTGEAP